MPIEKEMCLKITNLPKEKLAKLVLKAASKDKVFLNYILLTYFSDEKNDDDIFDEYLQKINDLLIKKYKGYAEEDTAINYITACNKEVINFQTICKNKAYLIDLNLKIIDNCYDELQAYFGTCFEGYEYKVSLLLKKIIKIVNTQLHPDFLLDYREQINKHLTRIKKSNYLDSVNGLPNQV